MIGPWGCSLFTPILSRRPPPVNVKPRPHYNDKVVPNSSSMRARSKTYPRAKVRKIIGGYSKKRVSNGVDSLVFLSFVSFMEEWVCPINNATLLANTKQQQTDVERYTKGTRRR